MRKRPSCPGCGGELRKKKRSKSNATGCLLGLIGWAIGIIVAILIPIIGWVLGPMIALAGSFVMWPKSEKIWRCRTCKYTTMR